MIKKILWIIYNRLFPSRQKIKQLEKQITELQSKIDYLKAHSDITKLTPATGKLREYQLFTLNYAVEVINELKQNIDIHPWMESGGLLGFVRHNGFIPWDDDLDFSLIREEYEKVIEYAKKNFVWVDTYDVKEKAFLFYDSVIKQHPNEYVAIKTPYCLHIYKGESVETAGNLEFFVWDYVKEDVSEEKYIEYAKNFREKVTELHDWNKIYDFYEQELKSDKFYSKEKTSRITPGIGHFDLSKLTNNGLVNVDEMFPLKKVKFESVEVDIPKLPERYLKITYGNYMEYPDDFGVSHNFEEISQHLNG